MATGKGTLSKQQRKNIKNGTAEVGGSYSMSHTNKRQMGLNIDRRNRVDMQRHSQSSKSSNWLHAVLFVVLLVIVVSWALEY